MIKTDNPAKVAPGSSGIEVTWTFQPKNGRKRKEGPNDKTRDIEPGNISRVSRLMALAIRFDGLVRRGEVRDYADLARLGYLSASRMRQAGVTRARITQIMNLLNLAPDIQEEILFLPRTVKDRDPILERELRPIAAVPHWHRQRKMWAELVKNRISS